ncbi:tol-pal system YbgF family protein [Planctomycetota bacterium]
MKIINKTLLLSLLVIISSRAIGQASNLQQLSKWEDQRRVDDFPIYSLLVKSQGAGNFAPEPEQWEMKGKLTDPEREPALQKILKEYPDSEYADDAALLLARAKLFYHNDANAAVDDLYKVISDYPDGNWISEDRIWLEMIPGIVHIDNNGQIVPRNPIKVRSGAKFSYFDYLEKEPHKTADEAKYWIAKIILSTNLKSSRYEEVITNLQEVVEKYTDPNLNRRAKDANAIGQFKDMPFPELMRAEQKCQHLLIKAYLDEKDYVNAATNAESYLSIYEGHPACEEVHMMAGEAFEALQQWDKAASHYEEFLSRENLGNATRIQYEQKLDQIKNKVVNLPDNQHDPNEPNSPNENNNN